MAKNGRKKKNPRPGMVETAIAMGSPGTTPPRAPTPPPARLRHEQHK